MKKYFYFCRELGHMVPGSFVYMVAVGTSDRDHAMFALVQEFCRDSGFYFKIRGDESDRAIDMAKKPWCTGKNRNRQPFKMPKVTISQLYRLIVDDSFKKFESDYVSSPFEIQMAMYDNPDYVGYQNKKKCNTECQPLKRQNLSDGECSPGVIAAIVACFILAFLSALSAFHVVCVCLFDGTL